MCSGATAAASSSDPLLLADMTKGTFAATAGAGQFAIAVVAEKARRAGRRDADRQGEALADQRRRKLEL